MLRHQFGKGGFGRGGQSGIGKMAASLGHSGGHGGLSDLVGQATASSAAPQSSLMKKVRADGWSGLARRASGQGAGGLSAKLERRARPQAADARWLKDDDKALNPLHARLSRRSLQGLLGQQRQV